MYTATKHSSIDWPHAILNDFFAIFFSTSKQMLRLGHNRILLPTFQFPFTGQPTIDAKCNPKFWERHKTNQAQHFQTKFPTAWSSQHTTLVDLQLDAQNSCLFTYNTFIKILYMFRALLCSSSGGLRRNYIYAASGIVTLCRWLSRAPVKKELPEAAYIQLRRRSPEDEQGNARNI